MTRTERWLKRREKDWGKLYSFQKVSVPAGELQCFLQQIRKLEAALITANIDTNVHLNVVPTTLEKTQGDLMRETAEHAKSLQNYKMMQHYFSEAEYLDLLEDTAEQ